MEIDTETVKKIARLSRIKITDIESADIQTDLNRIVEFVKKLSEVDALIESGVEKVSWCFRKSAYGHPRKRNDDR